MSWVVISHAITEFVQVWNHHQISDPTGGVPTIGAQHIFPNSPTDQAIHLFTQNGRHLTQENSFGRDLLQEYPNLQALCDFFLQDIHQ